MKIQRITHENLDTLCELENLCAYHPWSRDALRSTLEHHTTWGILGLNPDPAGYILTQRVLDEVEILTLGVHPRQRRRGVATTLLRSAHNTWRTEGVKTGFLEVREQNLAAIQLYLQHGWTQVGRRANYYGPSKHALNLCWTP